MPKSYDVEDLVRDIEALLKAKLTYSVARIEAEQIAAGHVESGIIGVDEDSYYKFGWTDEVLNSDVGLIISPDLLGTEDIGGAQAVRYSVDVSVVLSGVQNDSTANQKALRYAKALQRVFSEHWGKISPGVVREKIETMGPIDLKVNGKSNSRFKAAGVLLTVVLGC